MKVFLSILKILAFSIIMLIVYNVLNYFVLKKIKIKHKWIVLVLGIATIVLQAYIRVSPYSLLGLTLSAISIVFLLWFMDLKGFLKRAEFDDSEDKVRYVSPKTDNKKKDIIKPKAKANKAMRNDKNNK